MKHLIHAIIHLMKRYMNADADTKKLMRIQISNILTLNTSYLNIIPYMVHDTDKSDGVKLR